MPSPFTTTEPLVGPEITVTLAGSMVPSRSVSLAVTAMTTGVSSSVVALSSLATGRSFTSVTVMVTTAISQSRSVSQTW